MELTFFSPSWASILDFGFRSFLVLLVLCTTVTERPLFYATMLFVQVFSHGNMRSTQWKSRDHFSVTMSIVCIAAFCQYLNPSLHYTFPIEASWPKR